MSRVFILFLIWFSSTLLLYIVYCQAPSIDGEEGIRFPKDMEDLRRIAKTMGIFRLVLLVKIENKLFREQKYSYTLLLFSLAFLYKQTFAIPGSFFMVGDGRYAGVGDQKSPSACSVNGASLHLKKYRIPESPRWRPLWNSRRHPSHLYPDGSRCQFLLPAVPLFCPFPGGQMLPQPTTDCSQEGRTSSRADGPVPPSRWPRNRTGCSSSSSRPGCSPSLRTGCST